MPNDWSESNKCLWKKYANLNLAAGYAVSYGFKQDRFFRSHDHSNFIEDTQYHIAGGCISLLRCVHWCQLHCWLLLSLRFGCRDVAAVTANPKRRNTSLGWKHPFTPWLSLKSWACKHQLFTFIWRPNKVFILLLYCLYFWGKLMRERWGERTVGMGNVYLAGMPEALSTRGHSSNFAVIFFKWKGVIV